MTDSISLGIEDETNRNEAVVEVETEPARVVIHGSDGDEVVVPFDEELSPGLSE